MGSWWPKEFSWSQEALGEIGIEPCDGSFAYARGPRGFLVHRGRFTTWESPVRLVFTWQIAGDRAPQPDPAKAGEVEVRVSGEDGSTRVDLEHRAW